MEEQQAQLAAILATAFGEIDAAIGNDSLIETIVKDTKAKMDLVKDAEQVQAEQLVVLNAKVALESYLDLANYNAQEQAEIQTILANAYASIDESIGDTETIAAIVENTKAKLDKVLTSEAANKKAFEDAKDDATEAIKNYAASINYDQYSEEAMAEISGYLAEAVAAIEAVEESVENIDQFAAILADMTAKIDAVEKLPTVEVEPEQKPDDEQDSSNTGTEQQPQQQPADDQSSSSGKLFGGCGSVVGGIAGGAAVLGLAVAALLKKKDDEE